MTDTADEPQPFEASESMARRFGISRSAQDQWALRTHQNAEAAREARRFVGEIVPLRGNAEEMRDQSSALPEPDDFDDAVPFLPENGTLTPANTSAMHDGAAMVVIVSQDVWQRLGQPPALRLLKSASLGVMPAEEADAPIEATKKLYKRLNGFNPKDIGIVELSESSAAQAIAYTSSLGFDEAIVNPDGGAIVRGHPFGASGAVLVVRLFTRMVRAGEGAPRFGLAAQGAIGGLGTTALFERV